TGRVYGSGEARVVLLRQESDLPPDRRAADVYADANGSVGLSSLGLLRPRETGKRVGELSMGQRRRLDLALALTHRPHVLLLDEPTNHLSIALVDELTEALQATEAAVVLSTHDRRLLRDVGTWPCLDLDAYARV
ncbi:MAG TPA: ATP-binding cassette domain-containing protein, partial [Nocardiopsis listeri]|uniref:ATP-binding cassette domain-containing protein n=1 Tax=Nocardiopsis listeri TaxID=53440 RepID=UPI001D48DF01